MEKITGVNHFLNRLTEYYGASFKNESDKELWKSITLESIYNPNIDYDKLFKTLVKRAYNGNFIPDVKQINEAAIECYKQTNEPKWLHVKVYNPIYNAVTNTDCFLSGTTEEQMLKWYKKRFPNTEGWRIVEVYSLPEAV